MEKRFTPLGKMYSLLSATYRNLVNSKINAFCHRIAQVSEVHHPRGYGQLPRVAYGEFLSGNGLFVCSNFVRSLGLLF
jgi:hypothetical protein